MTKHIVVPVLWLILFLMGCGPSALPILIPAPMPLLSPTLTPTVAATPTSMVEALLQISTMTTVPAPIPTEIGPTATVQPRPTLMPTLVPVLEATAIPISMPTPTPTPAAVLVPKAIPIPMPEPTLSLTSTPIPTPTPTLVPTATSMPTDTPVPTATPIPTPSRPAMPTLVPRHQLFIDGILVPPLTLLIFVTGGTVTLSQAAKFDGEYRLNTRIAMAASGPPGYKIVWGGVDKQDRAFGFVQMVADRYVTLSMKPPTPTPTPTRVPFTWEVLMPTPVPTLVSVRTPIPVLTATPTPVPPGVPTPIPVLTATPTPVLPGVPTPIPTPTLAPTVTPMPTPTPTPIPPKTLEFHDLIWDVAPNVPQEQIETIQTGIGMAQTNVPGGDISKEIRQQIKVKVVATGSGNQEQGGGGACCTALAVGEPWARLFFDVLHPIWARTESTSSSWSLKEDLWTRGAHEYAHAWQNALGCLSFHNQPLGDWLNEGIAGYIAFQVLISANSTNAAQVRQFMKSAAQNSGQADIPLQSLETNSPVWPGEIGYLAVERLVDQAPGGVQSLANVCTKVGSGSSADEAFEQAFGISKANFYDGVSGGQLTD